MTIRETTEWRVARAIAVARGMDPDGKSTTAEGGTPRDCRVWETLLPSARAAVEAAGIERLIVALTKIATMGYAGAPDIEMRRIARRALAVD